MREDPRYTSPYPEPWHPLIDTSAWFHRPICWRGDKRSRPVVGRHGRDHYTKWPADATALKKAYGVGEPWDVHILGGAKRAIELLGSAPENWRVMGYDGITVPQFLDDLDFFVHFPHENYIEEFGRAVLEAMAAGKPAILSTRFRETFGDAAIYAEPDDVSRTIDRLWTDKTAYIARAEAGRAFASSCDISKFPERFERTLAYTERNHGAQQKGHAHGQPVHVKQTIA
jgi:glycosyltransferase involved in cell wall biosynthesis